MLGALRKVRLRELVEDRERSSAGDRIPTERAAEPADVDCVHQLRAPGHCGERQAAAERLARDKQVRLDAELLDRPHRAGTSATGLYLVVNVDDPVLVADPAQRWHELGGHRDETTLALHRLEHDARDRVRRDVLLEEEVEARERILGRDAAVWVRRSRAVDVRCERAQAVLVDELRRHGHRQRRASVECAVEDDDARSSGRGARDLDGVFDRLGAGVDEDRLRPGD